MAASTEAVAAPAPRHPGMTRMVRAVGLIRESPVGMIGVAIVVGLVLVAIFAALLAPFDPNATILPFQKPGAIDPTTGKTFRSEEHTSQLQSLMRTSYAVVCLNK